MNHSSSPETIPTLRDAEPSICPSPSPIRAGAGRRHARLGAAIGLGLLAVAWSGCVVKVGGNVDDEKPWRDEVRKPPAPVVVVSPNTEDSATLAEIDAAAKMSFDSGKLPALKNVATRPSLSPAAQVHLVNVGLRTLSFDAGRTELLLALIGNPAFSPAAKEAIFRQIERLDFDASRQRVMSAIQDRSAK